MTNVALEQSIAEYRGYLKCLARLAENPSRFNIYHSAKDNMTIDGWLEELLVQCGGDEKSEFTYAGYEAIEFDELLNHIQSFLFTGLLKADQFNTDESLRIKNAVLEDIDEFYGMMSTSIDTRGLFDPLLSSLIYQLNITNQRDERAFYFLVEIGEYFFFTYFRKLRVTVK